MLLITDQRSFRVFEAKASVKVKRFRTSLRMQKYKKNRLDGMNQYNAARAAGYSHSTARSASRELENTARHSMRDAFEQEGFTDKALVKYAMERLYAKHDIFSWGVKVGEKQDFKTQHAFFKSICELTGRLKPEGQTNNFNFSKTINNIHSNKTIIFQDLKDPENAGHVDPISSEGLHEQEGASGNRIEKAIQSP